MDYFMDKVLIERMMNTPAECIFERGDIVKFSGIARRRLVKPKNSWERRKKGRIVGFSRKYPWCVRIQWIEGEPEPIETVESYAWHFLDFADEEEG